MASTSLLNHSEIPTAQAIRPGLLRIESFRGSDALTVRYEDIAAFTQELRDTGNVSPEGLGVRLYLAGGQDIFLPEVTFDLLADAMADHYGWREAVMTLFVFFDNPSYVRTSAISAWSIRGSQVLLHLASGHDLLMNVNANIAILPMMMHEPEPDLLRQANPASGFKPISDQELEPSALN